jgi:hypothetical protein
VEYEVSESDRGQQATNVTGPKGAALDRPTDGAAGAGGGSRRRDKF